MICYKDIANGRKKILWYFLKWFSKRFTNPFIKASSHAKYLKEAIFQSYTWYTCYTCANNRSFSIFHKYLLFACFIVSLVTTVVAIIFQFNATYEKINIKQKIKNHNGLVIQIIICRLSPSQRKELMKVLHSSYVCLYVPLITQFLSN